MLQNSQCFNCMKDIFKLLKNALGLQKVCKVESKKLIYP